MAALLSEQSIPVAIVNPKPIRDYAKGIGYLAKTDALDAYVIAHFGQNVQPPAHELPSEQQTALRELMARRRQLLGMLTMERNRLKQVQTRAVQNDLKPHIQGLEKRLEKVDQSLKKLIQSSRFGKISSSNSQVFPGSVRSPHTRCWRICPNWDN